MAQFRFFIIAYVNVHVHECLDGEMARNGALDRDLTCGMSRKPSNLTTFMKVRFC